MSTEPAHEHERSIARFVHFFHIYHNEKGALTQSRSNRFQYEFDLGVGLLGRIPLGERQHAGRFARDCMVGLRVPDYRDRAEDEPGRPLKF